MKNPWIAFILNALLPGAGLWYLNRRSEAWLHFLALMVIAFIVVVLFPVFYAAYGPPLGLALSLIFGSLAFLAAKRQNADRPAAG